MVSSERDPRREGTIWMIDLDQPLPKIKLEDDVDFQRIGPESVRILNNVMGGKPSNDIFKRFQTGRQCYTAWIKDNLAAYGWVSFNEEYVGELRLNLRMLPGEAYIWDCVTLPAYRNRHLYTALLVHILNELHAGPFCRVWIGADLDNVISQHGMQRAGFHHIANLVIARVLTMRQVWVEGQPGVPEKLVDEARRVFLGDRDKVWLTAIASAR